MKDETAWLIFGWSLLAIGWLNFDDGWKSIPMFILAMIVFLLPFGEKELKPKQKQTKQKGKKR